MLIICINYDFFMDVIKTMMEEAIQQKGTVTGFGARLKSARELMHLSDKEAAARLHLSAQIIQTLESESLENTIPPTFMRGYIKSYARLLNISDQEVTQALTQMGLDAGPVNTVASPILLRTNNLYQTERYTHWFTYIVVSVLVVFVGIWWNSHAHFSLQKTLEHVTQQAQPVISNNLPTAAPTAVTAPVVAAPAIAAPVVTTTATNPPEVKPADSTAANTALAPAPVAAETPAAPEIALPPPATSAPITAVNTPNINQTAAPSASTAETPAAHHKTHDDDNDFAPAVPEPGLE